MPRSPAAAAPLARQPSAARPDAAPARLASPIDDSPRMLAQRRQIQSLFGPRAGSPPPSADGDVLQGYFVIGGQNTNSDELYADGADQDAKETQLWPTLKAAVKTAWEALPNHHFSDPVLEEFKEKLLTIAFAAGKKPRALAAEAQFLEDTTVHREQVAALETQDSPAGLGSTLTTSPALADARVKHSLATYRRTTPAAGGPAVVTDETFDSDAYTKGPSRRVRNPGGVATTPTTGAQAWTKKQVKDSIRIWTGDMPLVRHLKVTVWPLLANTDTGRLWERKFREMDRLITFRDNEAQSRYIEVKRDATRATVKSFDRKTYNKRARLAMKNAILANTRHPAEQQGVLFYDELLKEEADAAWAVPASATFAVGPGYSVVGDLSMILTHWRPILLFDWILAEDVLNNAADA